MKYLPDELAQLQLIVLYFVNFRTQFIHVVVVV